MASGDPILANKSGSYILLQNTTEKTYAGGVDNPKLTADGFEMAVGSFASPSTSQGSAMVVQKTIGVLPTVGYELGGAGMFSVITRVAGAAALTGVVSPNIASPTVIYENGNCVGIKGWAYDTTTNRDGGHASMWGGYFGVTCYGGNTTNGSVSFGAEFNIYNAGADPGYAFAYGATYGIGVYGCSNSTSTTNNTVGIDIGAQNYGGRPSKWHIGLKIGTDSIVPTSGYNNEAVLIQGGSTSALRYGGIRVTGNFDYGIVMDGATINSTLAMKLGPNQIIGWGTTGAANGSIYGDGAGTVVVTGVLSVSSTLRVVSGAAISTSAQHITGAVGIHVYLGNAAQYITIAENSAYANPVRLWVGGALKTINVMNGGDVAVGTQVLVVV
mgnify:CR=1 FL=1